MIRGKQQKRKQNKAILIKKATTLVASNIDMQFYVISYFPPFLAALAINIFVKNVLVKPKYPIVPTKIYERATKTYPKNTSLSLFSYFSLFLIIGKLTVCKKYPIPNYPANGEKLVKNK